MKEKGAHAPALTADTVNSSLGKQLSKNHCTRNLNRLQLRGLTIASQQSNVKHIENGRYLVRAQSHRGWYEVAWDNSRWSCQCKFNVKNHVTCKHIYAVLYRISPMDRLSEDVIRCPDCGNAESVIRRGVSKNKSGINQCYGCKSCGIRFVPRTAFNGMHHRASIVVAALDLFFKGLSLRKISDHIKQQYNETVTHQTVYRWIQKYLKLIKRRVKNFIPRVSSTWHADDTVQNVRGKYRHQWNLIDNKTRFFLATQMSKNRNATNAQKILDQGIAQAHTKPRTIITDGLASYTTAIKRIKKNYPSRLSHKNNIHLHQNNRVERLNNTLRERTKTMRGLHNMRSARRFAENYRLYYNFIRPHEALGGATPAEAAGMKPNHKHRTRWIRLINNE